MKFVNSRNIAVASVTGVLLAACGGGGGGGDAPPPSTDSGFVTGTDITVAATVNSKDAVELAKQIVADRTGDGTEPLVLGDAVLATSDTAEPEPL